MACSRIHHPERGCDLRCEPREDAPACETCDEPAESAHYHRLTPEDCGQPRGGAIYR